MIPIIPRILSGTITLPDGINARPAPTTGSSGELPTVEARGRDNIGELSLDLDEIAATAYRQLKFLGSNIKIPPKGRNNVEFGYDLLDVGANLRLALQQDFIFDPDNVRVTLSADGQPEQTGFLGDQFNLIAPSEGSGVLEVTAKYELLGDVSTEIGLIRQVFLQFDALKYTAAVNIGRLQNRIQGGPVFSRQFPEGGFTITDELNLFGSNPIDIAEIGENVVNVFETTYRIPYNLPVSIVDLSDDSVVEGDEGAPGEGQGYFSFNGRFYEWEPRTIEMFTGSGGDILSQIALDTLGTASPDAFNFIAFHNNIPDPDLIIAGSTIEVPKLVELPDQSGFAVFDISQSGNPSAPVKVNYSTANGTATAGSDYVATSGQLSIPAGQGGIILVPIVGDTREEETETFRVVLTTQDGTPFAGVSMIDATGTIIDDDDDDPPPPPDGGEGDSYNDPPMVSFDRLYYDFQAVGEFVLVESASEDLIIQVRQEPISETNQSVSINTAIATVVDGQRVGLYFDREQPLLIDGSPTEIPSDGPLILGDGRIFRQGNIYTIVYPTGDQLVAEILGWRIDIKTFLAEGREGEVAGILGNNNGDRSDEIALRDGTVLSQPVSDRQLYTEYANSWRITQAESLFDYEPGQDTNTFTNINFPVGTITIDDLDPVARQAAEALADAAGLTDPILRESAIIDLVLTRAEDGTFDQSIIERALESQIPEEALIIDFPPRAFDDFDSTIVNTSVSIDVLANDIPSPDGSPLVIDRFDRTSREEGSISLDDSGTPDDPTDDQLVFTPPADFSGFDLFKYTVSDGINTDTARVTVTVSQLNLSDIDGSNGFVLNGINIDDFSGSSVSGIGDINNDGIDDLIVGAPLADSNGNDNVGSSYVVFGSISGFPDSFDFSQLNGSNGFVINGLEVDNFSGISVSGVGDINDDGIDDLILGAFGTAPNGNDNAGSSYVIFGSNEAFPASFDLSELNGSNGFVIDGNNEFNHSGIVVSEAGDLNADGINDLLVNAPGPAEEGFGQSYAVFGRSEGFPARINPFDINGNNGFLLNDTDGNSGGDISSAGDINGDGINDLILGADVTVVPPEPTAEEPTEGEPTEEEPIEIKPVEAYVVFGTPGIFPPNVDLSNLDGSNGFVLDDGIEGTNDSGTFVSGIGDINGDGLDDIAVGDPNSNGSAGRIYVVFGSEEEFAASFDLFSLNGSNGFILNGIEAGDYAGISVSDAGDVNGDGFDDLIIGASDADINGEETDAENQNVGRSFLIFGKEEFDATLNLSQLNGRNGLIVNGVDQDERSGLAVSGAGDLNGDGIDDLAIGSPGSFFTESAGKTYVVFGSEDFGKQNNPPETAEDRATTARNTEVSIDVLANDSDIDDDILRVLNFTAPSNGSLRLDNNGTFRDISDDRLIYSPNPGFVGQDSFEYTIDDGNGGTETATVQVTVTSPIGTLPEPITVIRGTPSDDSLTGTEENNVILGFQGNDFLNGVSGDNVLFAGEGADTLTGGIGNDILYGDKGNELLNGGPGDDTLIGGSGRDILVSSRGDSDTFVLPTEAAVTDKLETDVIPTFETGIDRIGLTGGLTENDLSLQELGTNTIIRIAESNQILGIAGRVTPDMLSGSFVPINIDLF